MGGGGEVRNSTERPKIRRLRQKLTKIEACRVTYR